MIKIIKFSQTSTRVNNTSASFLGVLAVILVALKLLNIIHWSWWWVLVPLWFIPVFLLILFMLMIFISFVMLYLISRRR